MRIQRSTIWLSTFCYVGMVLQAGQVCAQSPDKRATIVAAGQHEVKLAPQKLRLTLTIQGQGTDATSAVRKLAEHKAKVKQELVALKAEESSIEFGATQVSSGVAGMPQQMQQYGARMIAQLARQAPDAKPGDLPKISMAVTTVRADWPLPTTDPDALALLPEALREQVKARDLRGEKNKAELDASQQERLEELQTAMQEQMGYYGEQEEVQFDVRFVATIDADARKAAIKSAYDQAMSQAEMLAGVTGKKLGNLTSLRASEGPGAAWASAYASMYGMQGAQQATVTDDEVTGSSPEELKLNVNVQATFQLDE